jgi:carbamate kinase
MEGKGGFANLSDMRILVALGGNALLRRGESAGPAVQQGKVGTAAGALAAIAAKHEVILTVGNGPQAGALGHMLELALRNALPDRDVIAVLPEVVVSAKDLAALGPLEPHAIADLRSLRVLVDAGTLVICSGGFPIAIDSTGAMRGVEAAVDEDLTAALLARRLDADLLLMLTDVDGVHLNWGVDGDGPLRSACPAELRQQSFAAGSMRPKVEAACRFVEATGRRAAIGALDDAVQVARGRAGTQVVLPRSAGVSTGAAPTASRYAGPEWRILDRT